MSQNNSQIALTPVFRISYPALIEPKPYMENGQVKGKPEFSVEMIFTPEQLNEFQVPNHQSDQLDMVNLEQLALRISKAEWGEGFNPAEAVKHGGMKWPVAKGEDLIAKKDPEKRDRYDHYEGMRIVRAKCPPEIRGEPNEPRLTYNDETGRKVVVNRQLDAHKSAAAAKFYAGAYAYAEVNLKPYDVDGRKYVTIYLNKIHFMRDGARIGAVSLMDRYDGIHGGQTDYDPTQGMGDEIP
jgi:hypothetical protein